MDVSQLLMERLDAAEWPCAESVLARAMWEAGSRLQLQQLECTGGVLERAAALQGMRMHLNKLTFTIPDGKQGFLGYCFITGRLQVDAFTAGRYSSPTDWQMWCACSSPAGRSAV